MLLFEIAQSVCCFFCEVVRTEEGQTGFVCVACVAHLFCMFRRFASLIKGEDEDRC